VLSLAFISGFLRLEFLAAKCSLPCTSPLNAHLLAAVHLDSTPMLEHLTKTKARHGQKKLPPSRSDKNTHPLVSQATARRMPEAQGGLHQPAQEAVATEALRERSREDATVAKVGEEDRQGGE
jgi:hypothetical protein